MTDNQSKKMEPARSVLMLFETPEQSGVRIVADALGLDYSSVYRWQLPRHAHGLHGKVPGRHFPALRALASRKKIKLPWELLTGQSFKERA